MANSVIGALRVMLGLDTAEFEAGATSAARSAQRLQRSIEATGQRLSTIGRNLTIGLTAPLAAFGTTAVRAAMESADASAQVQAALASMGNAAGRTQAQLEQLAETQMRQSLYDDDEILRKVTANLLTFGNIAGQQFDRAQQAALNLSARLGTDLQGSTMLVGRALNDPVRGLTALTRAGVSFTEQQRDQIRAMVDSGDMVGAQTALLAELERQFGGAAQAARNANPLAAMQQSWAEFQETVGQKLLPLLPRITDAIVGVLDAFSRLSPGMQTFVVGAGIVAAAVGPVLMALGGLITVSAPLTAALGALFAEGGLMLAGQGALAALAGAAGPLLPIIAALAAAGALIYYNWDKIAPVLEELWQKMQTTLGPPLRELVAAVSDAFSEFWNGPLGEGLRVVIGALGGFYLEYNRVLGSALITVLGAAFEVVGRIFRGIGAAIRSVNALLSGDWSAAWRGAVDMVTALAPNVVLVVTRMVDGVRAAFRNLTATFDWVVERVRQVERAFYDMADRVVFHSWVPDMVDGILQNFARLQNGMVNPALDATAQTENAFAGMAQNVLGSLQGMAQAIKGGGFFDILRAGLGLFQQLGQQQPGGGASILSQLFGASGFSGGSAAWSTASMPPGFATGGAMRLGGLTGIDRNLLSLNGAPLARVSAGEVLSVSPANDRGGGQMRVTVTMDPSTGALGAFVQDAAGRMLATATPHIVASAADAGVAKMMKINERSFG